MGNERGLMTDEQDEFVLTGLSDWSIEALTAALKEAEARRFDRVQTILHELRTLYGPTPVEQRLAVELRRRGVTLPDSGL
jgi:hypothetical protein